MSPIIFFTVLGFMVLDCFFLKKQAKNLFHYLYLDVSWWIVAYGLIVLVLWLGSGQWKDGLVYVLLFILPTYGVQRIRFKTSLTPQQKDPQQLGMDLSLALDAFGVMLLWFFGMSLAAMIVKVVFYAMPRLETELGELVALSAVSSVLMLILIKKSLHKYPSLRFRDILGLRRRQVSYWKIIGLPIVSGVLLAGISSWVLLTRAQQPATPMNDLLQATTSSLAFLAFLFIAVAVAPFVEEIIFRGYFFYIIEKIKGKRWAIVIIAPIFALMHFDQYWGDWAAIILVSILGFVLTWQRAWTGSSIPGIITHYVYNGAMTIIPVIAFTLMYPTYYEFQNRFPELDLAGKEQLLEQSIADYPRLAGPYNDLAWIYAQEGIQLEQALSLIETALELQPDNYAFLDTKAEVLYKMGRVEDAVTIAEDLVENYPVNAYSKEQLKKFREALPK